MSFFSYYEKDPFILLSKTRPNKYVSYYDWRKERQMNALLSEIAMNHPNTKSLYIKYLDHTIGWLNGVLNKHDIIFNYIKVLNPEYIKSIIDNYELNGQLLIDKYNIRTAKDKNIILYILNNYLINTTNKYIYDQLLNIMNLINIGQIDIDPYAICYILYTKSISKYHPTIINNIIYFRKLEQNAV